MPAIIYTPNSITCVLSETKSLTSFEQKKVCDLSENLSDKKSFIVAAPQTQIIIGVQRVSDFFVADLSVADLPILRPGFKQVFT